MTDVSLPAAGRAAMRTAVLADLVRAALAERYAAPVVVADEARGTVAVFAGRALDLARSAAGPDDEHRVVAIDVDAGPAFELAPPAGSGPSIEVGADVGASPGAGAAALQLWRQHGRAGVDGGELVTELLAGDPALRRVADVDCWWLVRTLDGAMGWVEPRCTGALDERLATDTARADADDHTRRGTFDVAFDPAAARLDVPAFLESVRSFLGTQYVWGGTTRSGVDCSGLVQRAAWESSRAWLPRHSRALLAAGRRTSPRTAAPGDVLILQRDPSSYDAERRAQLEAQAAHERSDAGAMPAHGPAIHPMHVAVVDEGSAVIHASRDEMRVVAEPLESLLARYKVLGARRLDAGADGAAATDEDAAS